MISIKNIFLIGNFFCLFSITLTPQFSYAQNESRSIKEYTLTIKNEMVNLAGKDMPAMTINGGIPGPTLRFTEGDSAVIHVINEMDVETSIHWHGILIPNFYDGVPYLTTPPIKAGETFTYKFPIRQNGTYWYHSHTALQEQSGVYGSFVIEPKEKTHQYNKELVLVLSDWTNQEPKYVLKNLKRGNEWYNIKKQTIAPLNRVIKQGALGAQLKFWRQRMESADIADVYYNAFLSNGLKSHEYPEFIPGDKIRVRIINASASSQYWLTFGGNDPILISADGMDVVPVKHNKTFIAIAETYDFIVDIPASGKIEIRAMAQDGSGTTSTFLGTGKILAAAVVPKPDKIGMMKKMGEMKMRMGAPSIKLNPANENAKKIMHNWGMKMKTDMGHADMDKKMMDTTSMKHMGDMDMKMDDTTKMKKKMPMKGMNMFAEYNYDYLKSPVKTSYTSEKPVEEMILNLTGNMSRYIWSINGVPLSESDKIKIEQGKVVRITINNLTMMHHPMHFHGHFFRVINNNGAYSPLKHTVNIPPMQKITIELNPDEYGDWFFHCHVLYHLSTGMARVFSYDTPRDPRMNGYPLRKLMKEGNKLYFWGMTDVASHMTGTNLVVSNLRNQLTFEGEYGWNKNFETELTYERYLYDYFRVFAGVNIENKYPKNIESASTTAIAGIRFFTPYMFNLDVRIDSKLRPQISLSRYLMIFPRTMLYGKYEYQVDVGLLNKEDINTNAGKNYSSQTTWSVGLKYFVSRNISLMASYDNRFGGGGGLSIRY
ncbi:multicopper oxidase domain-containing protein [Cytophaga aurantiaca]|uniref:multicopper oxidase domain-containing protein n=1 Tax=Cytophaga aurantiaca TaxID=29530 RepID=UPI00036C0A32|nr:multicopper oxidase domain-containing protein [Cytophaga aurantiaca]